MSGRPVLRMLRTIDGQRGRLLLAGLLGALALGCSVALLATSAYLISRASQRPPILYLQVAIVAVRAFGIGRGSFRYAERLAGHDAAFRGLARLRVRIYERLELLAPTGLRQWRRGDLLTTLVDDVDASLDLQLRVLLPFLSALLVGAASVAFAWWLLPVAGAILLAALLVGGVAVPAITVAAGGYSQRRVASTKARLVAEIVTAIESSADLIALQAAPGALRALEQTDDEATRLARRSAFVTALGSGLGTAAAGLAVIGSLLAAAAAAADGTLPPVLVATVVLLPLAAYESVQGLPAAVLTLAAVRGSAARVFDVVDAEPACPDPADPIPLPARSLAMRARGVAVSWPGSPVPAVAGIDLDLAPGDLVGIVGASGSGKSSLANALVRFLPYHGSLQLGGVEYADLAGDDVRSAVGILAQDAYIFGTTIEENLRLARRDAGSDAIDAAMRGAGLAQWVAGLAEGTATMVGAGGARLSGGQRQRIALARLLLAGHQFVVLDEPTEHLDPLEGDRVLTDCLAALHDRGVLLITHHLQQALRCDRVLVLADGRVVEQGDPRQLLAGGGAFAALSLAG